MLFLVAQETMRKLHRLVHWLHVHLVLDMIHGCMKEAVQLAVIEGARVGLDKPLKRHARRRGVTHSCLWHVCFAAASLKLLKGSYTSAQHLL